MTDADFFTPSQLEERGSCSRSPRVKLCLAAGHIASKAHDRLVQMFRDRDWELWDNRRIPERLNEVSKSGYEDDVAALVAKLVL
jgi:hypothetical protein